MRISPTLSILLLGLALAACPVDRGTSGDDDDNEDDDDSASQDDDDVLADDDDVLADDDDAGDDDDVQPDDDDTVLDEGIAAIEGSWMFGYLLDQDGDGISDVEVCQQHYEFNATIEFGPNAVGATCMVCSGLMQVSSATNVTATSTEVDTPCDPAVHFTDGQDFGEILTNPAYGMADFLHPQALIDVDTMLEVQTGTINSLSPDFTPAAVQQMHTEAGVQLTHFVMLTDVDGGWFQTIGEGGLASVAVAPDNVMGWLPFFTFYNGPGGIMLEMDGPYGIWGFWTISFGGGTTYNMLSFYGSLEAAFTPAP